MAARQRLGTLLATPIDDLELSVRSVNSLKNSNVRSLGDLVRQTESQILQVKNFGKKSLQEIADLLEREGLNFGMRYEESDGAVTVTDLGTPPSRAAAAAPVTEEVCPVGAGGRLDCQLSKTPSRIGSSQSREFSFERGSSRPRVEAKSWPLRRELITTPRWHAARAPSGRATCSIARPRTRFQDRPKFAKRAGG